MSRRALLLSLALASCGGEAEVETIEPEAAAATSAATRWVAPRAPDDASILEAPAVVRAPLATGDVSAAVRVRVVAIHATPGSVVAAGDPVVDVAAPELLDAAATYAGASRGARESAGRAAELEALRAEGLASNAQIFERRARATELATERDRAAAVLRAAGVDPSRAGSLLRRGVLTLEAPVAGVVAALHARVGEIHEPGAEPLATVVGEAAPRVEVRTSSSWPEARAIVFEASDGRSIALAPTPLATVVDPADGTRLAWYGPLEPCALPDGLVGTARVAETESLWEVPVTAVAQRTGRSELVRRRGDAVARVEVEVVGSAGASALVRGDLHASDAVAADVAAVEEAP